MHDQIVKRLAALDDQTESGDRAFLQTIAGNAENQIHHMIEVFLRMDVTISRTDAGAPVDKRAHRIMSFEPADSEEDDGLVVRSIRPGFVWRDRPVRPEEIVARRWKAPSAPAAAPAPLSTPDLASVETVLLPPDTA